MANRFRTSLLGLVLRRFHRFHLRFRWLAIGIAIILAVAIVFGVGEIGKAFGAIFLEQVLIKLGALAEE